MFANYFTVYFRRTIKFDARVANLILYYSNVNVLRNDNNVARVKSKRIETSICSIINIKLSTPIFGLPMLFLQSKYFFELSCLSVNIFVCKFVYIVRTDQNPFGSCQPFSILYVMMTACAAAYWATVIFISANNTSI